MNRITKLLLLLVLFLLLDCILFEHPISSVACRNEGELKLLLWETNNRATKDNFKVI